MGKETRRRLLRMALAALALAAAAALFLALRPPCLILKSTGLYCGACGFTRMVEELLQGNVGEAFRQNPYMFALLPLSGAYLACYLRQRPPLWKRKGMQALLAVAVGAGIVFTVLRNLPGFEALRPQ